MGLPDIILVAMAIFIVIGSSNSLIKIAGNSKYGTIELTFIVVLSATIVALELWAISQRLHWS